MCWVQWKRCAKGCTPWHGTASPYERGIKPASVAWWLERPFRVWKVGSLNPGRVIPKYILLPCSTFIIKNDTAWTNDHRLVIIALALRGLMASSCVKVPWKGTQIIISAIILEFDPPKIGGKVIKQIWWFHSKATDLSMMYHTLHRASMLLKYPPGQELYWVVFHCLPSNSLGRNL